jgi:flagellar biosynthesis protein FlhA
MDGASKFVRGDAVAGLIITAINILGGLAIGVLQRDLPVAEALATYTVLTVGDGLVAQLPALVTSTAAGIVVTRAASESNLSQDLLSQLTVRGRPLALTAAVLGVLGILPGLPVIPFLVPATMLGLLAYRLRGPAKAAEAAPSGGPAASVAPERVEGLLPIDPLVVEVGYGLLAVVDQGGAGTGNLLDRIRVLRRQFATELGFVVPPIRIRDNALLGGTQYGLKIRGVEVARGEVYPDRFLAMNPATTPGALPEGIDVREPTFGLPARWISRASKDQALAEGCTVVDASTVIATHLSETIRRHANSLLGRQEVQALIDRLRETHPAVVEGLVPGLLALGAVHRVLQRLLAEGVSIRDLPTILEVLADAATVTKDPALLTEHARAALADAVCQPYLAQDGSLQVLLLSPGAESRLLETLGRADADEGLAPGLGPSLLDAIGRTMEAAPPFDNKPVLLCASALRRHLRRLTERTLPHLGVLSFAEIPPTLTVKAMGAVDPSHAAQAV